MHSRSIQTAALAAAMLAGVAFAGAPAAKKAPKVETEFTTMDADQDGKISASEHATGSAKMFETMDANKDGKVSAAEMTAASEKVTGKKADPSEMSSAEKIKAVDMDNDGVLTAAEHASGSQMFFTAMDGDKDGFVTKAELEAGHKLMMKPAPKT